MRGKAWQGVLQGLGLGLICILSKTSRKLKLKTKPKLRLALKKRAAEEEGGEREAEGNWECHLADNFYCQPAAECF